MPGFGLETIQATVAAVLTVLVLGYILGDVPGLGAVFRAFYRLALHILIGAAAAYALVVAFSGVLWRFTLERLVGGLAGDNAQLVVAVVGLGLCVLLLTKLVPRLAWMGNIATGYLIGVGLGVAAGGAIIGTLYGQAAAASRFAGARSVLDMPVLLIGTLAVLVSFTFTVTWRRGLLSSATRAVRFVAGIGRFFIYAALGIVFAGVYVAGISVFVGQVQVVLTALGRIWPAVPPQ